MKPKTRKYSVVLACAVLALVSLAATADDKKGDKPTLSGTWGKKDGMLKMEFAEKNVLKLAPHGDSTLIAIVCDYTVEKEGLVQAKITGFEGQEQAKKQIEQLLSVGLKFRFKWTVNGDTARLDDVTGEKVETLKSHLEGDFEKK
jgi:hypothetical protein